MTPSIETLLLSQGQQLQALARGLLADEHGAEDVLQEAWLKSASRSLEARQPLESASAWIKSVVRHLALDRKRAGRSRAHHEQRAARPEATPSTAQTVAEREVWQRVIDAVSELEEPYKSVIIMRYFQNVPPRRIASERGVPLATTKSQLNRALGMLRARLDELSQGDRSSWAIVLAGAGGKSRVAWGGLAALSLMVGGLVMIVYGNRGGARSPVSSSEPPIAVLRGEAFVGGSAAQSDSAALETEPGPSTRSRVGQEDSTRVLSSNPAEAAPELPRFGLDIEVVDELDAPVWKAEILLAAAGHPINSAGFTGPRGKLELRWPALEAKGKFTIAVRRRGELRSGLRAIELRAGEALELRIGLHEDRLAGWRVPSPEPLGSGFAEPGSARMSWTPLGVQSGSVEGEIQFRWSELPATRLARTELERERRLRGRPSRAMEAPSSGGSAHQHFTDFEREAFTYKGTVLRPGGQPAAGVRILNWTQGESSGSLPTFPDGHFEYSEVPRQKTWLRAGGGHFGQASISVPFDSEDESDHFDWNPTLDRGHEAVGSILIDHQLTPGVWLVDAELAGGRSIHVDTNRFAGGEFAIPNLPEGAGRLTLMTAGSWPLAIRVQDAHFPSDGNRFELEAADLRAAPVDVLVLDPSGAPCQAEVQLWQVSSDRGVWLEFDEQSGRHQRSAVPRGAYRILVGDEQHGYTEHGVYQANGPDALLIGPLQLKAPGHIQVRVNGELPSLGAPWTWQLERVSGGITTIVAVDPLLTSGELEVPEGRYRLGLTGPDFIMPAMELDVPAGGVVEAEVTLKP